MQRPQAEAVVRLVLLLAGCAAVPAWAETKFEPSISVSAIYVDNIDLAPPGAAKNNDLVGQVVPRLQLEQKSPRLTSAFDYSAQALFFRDRSELNDVYHNGQANAAWIAVPDLFFIDGWASYAQQTVDPTQPRNTDNLFSVSNVADEFSVLVAPYLRRDFGSKTGLLRYAASSSKFIGVSATNATRFLQDSFSSIVTAQLAADDAGAPVTWSLDGRSAHTTFDTAQTYRADRVSAEGSVSVLQSLRLIAAAGAETNILESSTKGGLDAGFWSAGFKWAPNERGAVEARAGHRFFGNSYSLHVTRESRFLAFQANYSEEPTTTGQSDALTEFVPGEIASNPQAYTTVTRSSNTYSPFLLRQFDASIELRGRLTQIALRAYRMRREYLDALQVGRTDSTLGGVFTVNRDLNARAAIGVIVTADSVTQLSGFDYRDRRYEAYYTHKLGATLEVSLRGVHLVRSGDFEYEANVGQLTLQKSF